MCWLFLGKAFDYVNWNALWEILQRFGCPTEFNNMICLLHDDMQIRILSNGSTDCSQNWCRAGMRYCSNGFSIITAVMLDLMVGKLPVGVPVTYRIDVKLFNLCRLNAKTRLRLPVSLNFNTQLVKLTNS